MTHGPSRRSPSTAWIFPWAFLAFCPLSLLLYALHAPAIPVFIITFLGIIPATSLIARSTNELSLRTSTTVGSLLNATFGNAIELFIAIFAIRAGLVEMVQASISGSIILNILLLIGASMLFGGMKHREQLFNKESAGVGSTMLLIAVAGLSLPTIYQIVTGKSAGVMSQAVSITLAATYIFGLFFTLFTHRHLFVAKREAGDAGPRWTTGRASLVLLTSVAVAAIESEVLVNTVGPLTGTINLSEAFIGMVIIAVITNVPEHIAAISFGLRDNITLSLEIGMNSAIQIALFVAPILVFVSPLVSGQPFTLAFSSFELVGLVLAVAIINFIGSDGICNWLEGVQLVAVYAIIATAFFFI
ncbi:MAG: calcium/proton exchanger [Chloroflexi bacterium]|nr:calcium/proton exchanger [Chloroflexota bacterium]